MKTFIVITGLVLFFAIMSVFSFPKIWLTEVKFLIGMVMGLIVYIGMKDATNEEE